MTAGANLRDATADVARAAENSSLQAAARSDWWPNVRQYRQTVDSTTD